MQSLSPISPDETLTAAGVYLYHVNEQAVGVRESWKQHLQRDGSIKTRVERSAAAYGSQIWVESTAKSGNISVFDILWRNNSEKAVPQAAASYQITDETVSLTRTIADRAPITETYAKPAGMIVSPLMRVYIGSVIRSLLSYGDAGAPVLVPWIIDPSNDKLLLSPIFDRRSAREIGTEVVQVDESSHRAMIYEYIGGNYQEGTRFWVNDHDMLLRYIWQANDTTLWDVRLAEYHQNSKIKP